MFLECHEIIGKVPNKALLGDSTKAGSGSGGSLWMWTLVAPQHLDLVLLEQQFPACDACGCERCHLGDVLCEWCQDRKGGHSQGSWEVHTGCQVLCYWGARDCRRAPGTTPQRRHKGRRSLRSLSNLEPRELVKKQRFIVCRGSCVVKILAAFLHSLVLRVYFWKKEKNGHPLSCSWRTLNKELNRHSKKLEKESCAFGLS